MPVPQMHTPIKSGEKMVKYTDDQILELVTSRYDQRKIYILAPLIGKAERDITRSSSSS